MMTVNDIKIVCVVGAGQMGKQIALQAAISGYTTYLYDSFPEAVTKAKAWSTEYLQGRVEKGKMTEPQVNEVRQRFHPVSSLDMGAKNADLVIEAIIERVDDKKDLFKKLDKIVREDTLIVTNSSFLVSSMFTECIRNPGRLANLHYFNPALVMKLVEIVRGPHTAEDTVTALHGFVQSIGKIPVTIQKEVDGFIVNYISNELTCAALRLAAQGVASPEDIDLAMENGLNHPMGPFRMMDLTGIDLAYEILIEKEKRGEFHEGTALVKAKVDEGKLGRKTGCGWYDYTKK